jgi:hypothetical protein
VKIKKKYNCPICHIKYISFTNSIPTIYKCINNHKWKYDDNNKIYIEQWIEFNNLPFHQIN